METINHTPKQLQKVWISEFNHSRVTNIFAKLLVNFAINLYRKIILWLFLCFDKKWFFWQ
jgi:hypothetical protein